MKQVLSLKDGVRFRSGNRINSAIGMSGNQNGIGEKAGLDHLRMDRQVVPFEERVTIEAMREVELWQLPICDYHEAGSAGPLT
jgi:hypothetical protein